MNINKKLVIVGGGPAGLAAAVGALEAGMAAEDMLIVERDAKLGGILNQCIHAGFGLHRFGEELTGPEYADKYIKMVEAANIPFVTNAMVLSISEDRVVTYACSEQGIVNAKADAVILAMGCRERTRGALNIPGTRPAGVFSAGTAQRYVNINGFLPGRKVVILGSGDIGLIMARRMTLEGAEVQAVCELMPYSSGLARNIAQCLNDFDIPLYLSTTVVQIHGKGRLEGVTVASVDKSLKPIPGTERYIECDALLLSCGLIPENELSVEAGIQPVNKKRSAPCRKERVPVARRKSVEQREDPLPRHIPAAVMILEINTFFGKFRRRGHGFRTVKTRRQRFASQPHHIIFFLTGAVDRLLRIIFQMHIFVQFDPDCITVRLFDPDGLEETAAGSLHKKRYGICRQQRRGIHFVVLISIGHEGKKKRSAEDHNRDPDLQQRAFIFFQIPFPGKGKTGQQGKCGKDPAMDQQQKKDTAAQCEDLAAAQSHAFKAAGRGKNIQDMGIDVIMIAVEKTGIHQQKQMCGKYGEHCRQSGNKTAQTGLVCFQ